MSDQEVVAAGAPAGRLGVLFVGMGSLSSTLVAGVAAVRRGLGRAVGSLAEMGRVMGPAGKPVAFREAVPLAGLDSLVFGGWDLFPEDCYSTALRSKVLGRELLDQLRPELESVRPWRGIYDPRYVRRIEAKHFLQARAHLANVKAVQKDILSFQEQTGADRVVLLNTASTEAYRPLEPVHATLKEFEKGLASDDQRLTPSMIYSYAALRLRVPMVNCTPSPAAAVPALLELAGELRVPMAGSDLKTGQTMLKTIIAPGLKARVLGLHGWYSANILGNRDGEVLDDPECLKSKQQSKLSALGAILEPDLYPELYGSFDHQVHIDFYPPRRDNKEAWDNIDIFGWLDYPMQIKVNFLCRDSILAAPLALDLALFIDLAQRHGSRGAQEWLSLFFKSPISAGGRATHDLLAQRQALEDEVRRMAGWKTNGRNGRQRKAP